MSIKSAVIAVVTLAAGSLGGVVAYQVAAPASPAEGAVELPVVPVAEQTAQDRKQGARWAPCEPPAKRKGKRCVTEVVRTVEVASQGDTTNAPIVPAGALPPAPVTPLEDSHHHGGEGEEGRHGDDDHGDDSDHDDSDHDDSDHDDSDHDDSRHDDSRHVDWDDHGDDDD